MEDTPLVCWGVSNYFWHSIESVEYLCPLWVSNSPNQLILIFAHQLNLENRFRRKKNHHNNNNGQYLYRNVQFSKASLNGLLFLWGRKPECPEETLEIRLRSTETQSTYNICSRGGRRDWCPLRQPDFPRSTAQGIISRWSPIQISTLSNRA